MPRYGLVVVGAGIAGLYAALSAADDTDVLVLCRGELASSNSFQAQGGVAAALGEDDDPSLHAADTLRTGRGICSERAVGELTRDAPARIAHLVELGVAFDDGLGREGGHSRRRIVHAGGAQTGRRIAEVLAVRAREHPRITIREGAARARRLDVRWALRRGPDRPWRRARAGDAHRDRRLRRAVGADDEPVGRHRRGDRAGLPRRCGGRRPRAGAVPPDGGRRQRVPAVRGASRRGRSAPRRPRASGSSTSSPSATSSRARSPSADRSGLDLRAIERGRFPSLMATLERDGYDPATAPIPVSPAAHYTIGGIVTDVDGRTTVPGLFAAGECAATGVHGANRLASNSLLECLVFGRRAARAALAEPARGAIDAAPAGAGGRRARGRHAARPQVAVAPRGPDPERRRARAAQDGAAAARAAAR